MWFSPILVYGSMDLKVVVIKGFNLIILPVENEVEYQKLWSNILTGSYCINVKKEIIAKCRVKTRMNLVAVVFFCRIRPQFHESTQWWSHLYTGWGFSENLGKRTFISELPVLWEMANPQWDQPVPEYPNPLLHLLYWVPNFTDDREEGECGDRR